MPKLHGMAERTFEDIYDALFYGPPENIEKYVSALRSARLFGNANIGNPQLTNMLTPGQFPNGHTMVVTNWYARTTLPKGGVLDQYANATLVSLSIGNRCYRQVTLAQLLDRKAGQDLDLNDDTAQREQERDDQIEAIRSVMFGAYAEAALAPYDKVFDSVEHYEGEIGKLWQAQSRDQQAGWRLAAIAAYRHCNPIAALVIPERQGFEVNVTTFDEGMRALLASIAPWREGAPGLPGLWIHLEGFVTRRLY